MQSRSPAVCQQSDALRSNPPEPHDDERLSLLLTDLMDHANVGMVERGCHLRFPLKPRQRLRIFGSVVRQELQGYESVGRRSVRLTTRTRCSYIHRRSVPVPGAASSMVGLSKKLRASRHAFNSGLISRSNVEKPRPTDEVVLQR